MVQERAIGARALNRDARGLRAAIGTNPELQAYTVRRAEELAGRLVTVLEDPKETDSDRLSRLGEALAELAAKMEPKEAAALAARGAQRLAGLLEDPKETDADRLSTLGEGSPSWRPRWSPRRQRLWQGVARAVGRFAGGPGSR